LSVTLNLFQTVLFQSAIVLAGLLRQIGFSMSHDVRVMQLVPGGVDEGYVKYGSPLGKRVGLKSIKRNQKRIEEELKAMNGPSLDSSKGWVKFDHAEELRAEKLLAEMRCKGLKLGESRD